VVLCSQSPSPRYHKFFKLQPFPGISLPGKGLWGGMGSDALPVCQVVHI
jgi:hypothetical protein